MRKLGLLVIAGGVLALTACGSGNDDGGNGGTPTPTPVVARASVGYRLLGGIDQLAEPKVGSVRLYSSHDPRDAANIDFNQYLRRESGNTYVMVDHQGPGVITRIWMTARTGSRSSNGPGFYDGARLKVYVDGSVTPLIAVRPSRFFAGDLWPFVPPLVGQHENGADSPWPDGKGFYSYVPISFSRSVVVKITDPLPPGARFPVDRLFYHVNVLDLTGQESVEPSPILQADGSLGLSAEDQYAFQKALEEWGNPVAFAEGMTVAAQMTEFPGPVSGTSSVAELAGPGVVRGLRLYPGNASAADLEKLWFRVTYDGESSPAINVPVGTAWGNHFSRASFSSLVQGVAPDGGFYLRFPLPFRQSLRLELRWEGSGSLPVSARVYYDEREVSSDVRYLHADFVEATVLDGRRLTMADVTGAGHLVGCQLVVDVRSDPQSLEGDEFITVDGTTSYKGTGTEDYFNAHWFFEGGLRTHPLHGLTSRGARIRPDVHTHRFMVPDLLPFSSSLLFELENGNVPGQADDYRSVVFYYLAH